MLPLVFNFTQHHPPTTHQPLLRFTMTIDSPPPLHTIVATTRAVEDATVATKVVVMVTTITLSVGIPIKAWFFGTCNHCGIGYLPSQCPNYDPFTTCNRPTTNFANSSAYVPSTTAPWYLDITANIHVTPDLASMDENRPYHVHDNLHVCDGKGLPILHIGTSHSPKKMFNLSKILHVPNITKNLLSVPQFCIDNHVFLEFHSTFVVLKNELTRTTLLTGPSKPCLYSLSLP